MWQAVKLLIVVANIKVSEQLPLYSNCWKIIPNDQARSQHEARGAIPPPFFFFAPPPNMVGLLLCNSVKTDEMVF